LTHFHLVYNVPVTDQRLSHYRSGDWFYQNSFDNNKKEEQKWMKVELKLHYQLLTIIALGIAFRVWYA